MKKKLKKQKKIILILLFSVIFIIFIVPLIINILFSLSIENASTVLSGDSHLQYYGSVLGSLLMFIILFITIQSDKEARQEERKLNDRVYLTFICDIEFNNLKHLLKRAVEMQVFHVPIYPQWNAGENAEFKSIFGKSKNPNFKEDFRGILIENLFNKPVFNFNFKFIVDYEVELKEYGPVVARTFAPHDKKLCLYPMRKDKKCTVKEIKMTYTTLAEEKIECIGIELNDKIRDVRYNKIKINTGDGSTLFHDIRNLFVDEP